MYPYFILPNDVIKLTKDGTLNHTKQMICTQNGLLDSSETFLKNLDALPAKTILEASEFYVRARNEGESCITFKIISGPIKREFNNIQAQDQISELRSQIEFLNKQKQSVTNSKYGNEILWEVKNREKRIRSLSVKNSKSVYVKLIKVSITDIESWSILPAKRT